MHIVLCGSMTFFDDMQQIVSQLKQLGHTVTSPSYSETEKIGNTVTLDEKRKLMMNYFDEIKKADAILVYNKAKHNISGYIGANTLIELAVACAYEKPIYLWQPVGDIAAKEEIEAMKPVIIDKKLHKINTLS